LNFSVAHSILAAILKVLKRLIPKNLGDSWNLQGGLTNVGSGSWRFPISFMETRWQGVKLYWRHANKFGSVSPIVLYSTPGVFQEM